VTAPEGAGGSFPEVGKSSCPARDPDTQHLSRLLTDFLLGLIHSNQELKETKTPMGMGLDGIPEDATKCP